MNSPRVNADFDVAVVGGGPNGATTAALLARHGGFAPARIALVAPELATAAAANDAIADEMKRVGHVGVLLNVMSADGCRRQRADGESRAIKAGRTLSGR